MVKHDSSLIATAVINLEWWHIRRYKCIDNINNQSILDVSELWTVHLVHHLKPCVKFRQRPGGQQLIIASAANFRMLTYGLSHSSTDQPQAYRWRDGLTSMVAILRHSQPLVITIVKHIELFQLQPLKRSLIQHHMALGQGPLDPQLFTSQKWPDTSPTVGIFT